MNITVWVYNDARIHREALIQAKSTTGRIFRQAGVKVAWIDCPCSEEEMPKYPDCGGALGPSRLVLNVLPRSRASRKNGHSTVFGRALLPSDGGFGLRAGVYAYGAEELAGGQHSRSALILGHLMAHELGHLLIGTEAHSPVGVMQADWSDTELKRAVQGRLLFSRKDAKQIRDNVRERMRAEEAADITQLRASR